ncbi:MULTISPECIES: acyl-CoA thioesterase [Crateriforma]|nr:MULTISPECIES: thioesterase family protein [Crateriforma]
MIDLCLYNQLHRFAVAPSVGATWQPNPPVHWKESTPMLRQHSIEIRVRYDECDPMGFVHHSRYLQYFEMGRTELLRASGGNYREMEEAGQLVVVVRVDCRYRRPACYDDLLRLETEITGVTAGKILHQYHLYRDQELLVQADVTLAVIDRKGQIQRVPEFLRTAFSADQSP